MPIRRNFTEIEQTFTKFYSEQTRDFSFASDVVDATMLAAISRKAEGEIYNIGTGKETSINELARAIIDLTGNSFDPVNIDRRGIDNLRRRVLNIEKIRKDLKWIPETTLKKGLRKTYLWFRKEKTLPNLEKNISSTHYRIVNYDPI